MAPRTPAMIAVVFSFCVELVDGVVVLVVAGLGVVVLLDEAEDEVEVDD